MPAAELLSLLERMSLLRDEPPDEAAWRDFLLQLRKDARTRRPSSELRPPESSRCRRAQALVRESPLINFTLSVEDGSITSLNPAFETLTGRSRGDWMGHPMTHLVHPEDRALLVATIHQVTLGFVPRALEIRWSTALGSYIAAEWTLRPLVENGQVRSILGFSHDITRQKVSERDLSTAKDAAEAANQAKGEFLANMSHEIRTPMNAIVGMTSLLLDTVLSQEQRGYTETLKSSCHTLLDLVDDILDFSKIESGKLELEKQPFDVRHMVAEASYMVQAQATKKGLQLGFAFSESCPEALEGDIVRVRQVLVNLLSNAVKFTDRGSIQVRVEARPVDDAGLFTIHFEVEDTGCGIAPEQQAKIFDAFGQAQASTSRRYGGTGLGLSICRRLTELMGGTVGVESELGKGSRFFFTIQARAARMPFRAEISEEFDAKLAIKHPLRILVADDHPTNRKVAKLLLARRGYEARTVAGGFEALEVLEREPFDLVFMDILMPELDGLETTRRIMDQVPEQRRPQIVAMTASAMQGDREQCLAVGMVDFISKPINESELETVLTLCSQRRRNPDLRPHGKAAVEEEAEARRPASEPGTMSLSPTLQKIYEKRPEEVVPLLETFLKTTDQSLRDLTGQIQDGDFQAAFRTAHSLKGSCFVIGAKKVAELCVKLESKADAESLDGCLDLLQELNHHVEPVRDYVSGLIRPS